MEAWRHHALHATLPLVGRGESWWRVLTRLSTTVDSVAVEEQERERRRQVVEKFQKAPFEEIAAHCGARVSEVEWGPSQDQLDTGCVSRAGLSS